MCRRHSCCMRIALAFVIVFVLLQCGAVVTPYWVYVYEGTTREYFGLWQTCTYTNVGTTYLCSDVFSDSRYDQLWFYLVQAFACFALFLALVTMTVAINQHCNTHLNMCTVVTLAVFSYFTSAIIITSLILFVRNVGDIRSTSGSIIQNIKYMHVSTYFSSVAMILSMLAGSFFIIVAYSLSTGRRHSSVQDKPVENTGPYTETEPQRNGVRMDKIFRTNKIHDNKYFL